MATEPGAGEEAKPEGLAPIIVIKKIEDGHGGAHGGAWKIALADMMTAMMAFFLLMWILGAANEQQRKSIADYFKPTSHSEVAFGELAGSNGMLGGSSIIDTEGFPFTARQTALFERVTPRSEGGPTVNDPSTNSETARDTSSMTKDQQKEVIEQADNASFAKLEQEVKDALKKNPNFEQIQNQVEFVREKEGLRIEIIDKADFAMFGLGTSKMDPKAKGLLDEVSKSLKTIPNKVSVRGHTDSVAFVNSDDNNWALSASRADATRQILEKSGVKSARIERIEGVADTSPYNKNDPLDPRNRRISITVKYRDG